MSALVIDANVWVAAADPGDTLSEASRRFLRVIMRQRRPMILPSITTLEVACALSRRFRSAALGRSLANRLQRSEPLRELAFQELHERAIDVGTESLLRAADALYAAAARETGSVLISWDQELIERAGALSPEEWLGTQSEV